MVINLASALSLILRSATHRDGSFAEDIVVQPACVNSRAKFFASLLILLFSETKELLHPKRVDVRRFTYSDFYY
jgi:hypothetical protein